MLINEGSGHDGTRLMQGESSVFQRIEQSDVLGKGHELHFTVEIRQPYSEPPRVCFRA
jgi:hypothetical protein